MINNGKAEHSLLKQENRNTEIYRSVKKLGSLPREHEVIKRRNQLSIAAMNNMD